MMTSNNHNIKHKKIYFKVYQDLSQLGNALKQVEEHRFADLQVSVLGKIEHLNFDKSIPISKGTKSIKTYWSKLLGNTINFGTFYNDQTGPVFIVGPLASTFLHKINGKLLATLSSGPYGIFRGIGATETQAAHYLKSLNNGHYLLIVRGAEDNIHAIKSIF